MNKQELIKICEEQRNFIDKELLVQWFLEIHEKELDLLPNIPTKFQVYINEKVIRHFNLDTDNPEYLWENISELVNAIESGEVINGRRKYIGFNNVGGVFSQIAFVPKKDRATILEMHRYVIDGDMSGDLSSNYRKKK